MTGQLLRQTQEPDWKWSDPPRSASDCDAESLLSVIRTEEEVYTGSVNTSVATGRAEPSEVLVLSDSVIFSPRAQIHGIEEGSESATVKPDMTIRTGGEGRMDDVKFDTNNGQSGSSVVSPSSDSGVHSLDEHWDCMSTVSGDSDSIQSIITVYDGVVCEADSPPVLVRDVLTREIVSFRGGTYGIHDSMANLSSNGRNSDIAAMSDFSEEEDEAWEEVGPCGDAQPNIRTDCVGEDTINSGEHSVLPATPTEVTHNVMEHHDEDYWTNFRLLARQAFKLDDVKLAASSYPDAVKELVVRSRLTIENYPSADDHSDSDSDSDTSYYECPLKVEFRDGWQYNTYTDGLDKKYYTKAEGHGLTLEMEIEDGVDVYSDPDARAKFELSPDKIDVCSEPDTRAKFELSPNQIDVCPDPDDRAKFELSPDKIDVCSEPDTRAKFELSTNKIDVCPDPDDRAKFDLSPTKHVVELDNIRVKCITDGDVTVIRENVAGDSDAHEDEYIGLSMISVDETRKDTSVDVQNSLGTRECVIPECVTQPTLVAYGDSALCNKESLQIMRKYCFGLCGSTNQFHSTDFEWCVECVNRLIWGFLVSCVVSIVMRNRLVGTNAFIKGSDVVVSISGLLDGLIASCDAMRECLWRTEDFKDTLSNVMLGIRARMISHDIPWGADNGQVLPITKEVQSQKEGNDHVRRLEEGDGTTRMTGGGLDTGPGMMMFSARPERDVSEGPDEARRSVDHVSPSPVHDEDRQVVGGPVGRFPSSDTLLTDDGSVLSKDRRDDVISRQYEVVPFTDVPRTTEHRDDRPGAIDFDGTTQTRSESGCLDGMDRFPDRHVHQFVDRPPERHVPTVVAGTYTTPIHRKRGRKYVELKACESDADDYFASAEQDSRWSARAVAWYEPCD